VNTLRPRLLVLALALAISLATAAPAFAQSPVGGYGGVAGESEKSVGGGNGAAVPSGVELRENDGGDTLAFTGFELGLLSAIALGLLASGFALWRLSAPSRARN
jgi:hypothetical protein